VLCNLAVAANMRRRGVALALCRAAAAAAHTVVRQGPTLATSATSHEPQPWSTTTSSASLLPPRSPSSTVSPPPPPPPLPRLMLKVERDNASALALYKTLGYQPYSRISNDPALRLDVGQGILVPVQVESYLLQLHGR
jgi:GNAT superfamily N-acetyltransferase